MAEFTSLPLRTEDGRPLVHKYRRQAGQSAGLLLLFPGNLYGVDGPLLFYPSAFLFERGWDTLGLSYGFQSAMASATGETVMAALRESELAVADALAQRPYPRVGLIGKSLGASVVAHLCATTPQLSGARAVYLTPLLGVPLFDGLFSQTSQSAFLAIGSADTFYDVDALRALDDNASLEVRVLEGADHSLVVPGDLPASLRVLERVCSEVVDFLDRPWP
jgi:dienelactone hydrolase